MDAETDRDEHIPTVEDKVVEIEALSYFKPFRARANLDEFDRIMLRTSSAPPQPGDGMPED